ncbi:MAG: protein kinase [Myxococcota bacterium]
MCPGAGVCFDGRTRGPTGCRTAAKAPMEAEPETKVVDHESKAMKNEPAPAPSNGVGPQVVDRYELVHRLGHGGMATVHLGRATGRAGFEKLVAVKVIHPHLASEPEFVDMFLDEARIAARLHHPHVVQILDVGEDDGVYFMVMEYVEGDTLSSLIRQLRKHEDQLPLSAVLQIAADAAEGLAAAHELEDRDGNPLQLVHRDVSPHNLLVGMDGNIKVVDFGIMKAAGKRSNTLTGQLRGKLSYMSPEQARGRPLDHRTDLFALGAVIWELCTNRRLFEADSDSETLELVRECKVPDLSDVRPDLPDGLAEVLRKCLARDAADRYDSAQQMLRDIRAVRRDLSADVDARADLAEVMAQFFTARIDYVRAAVRRREGGGVRPMPSASASLVTPEVAANGDATAIVSPPRGTSIRPSESAEGVAPHTGTATMTTALGQPARHWSLWLVLPLVGAAIGTAVVGWGRGERDEQVAAAAPAIERTPEKVAEESPMTAVPNKAVETSVPSIKWTFNTQPQGAYVTIAGTKHDEPTPFTVALPRSDDSVLIRIEREGYRSRVVRLAPRETEKLSYPLSPAPAIAEGAPAGKTRLWPRKKKTGRAPVVAPTPPPEPTPKPDETKDERPDFGGLLRDQDKPK